MFVTGPGGGSNRLLGLPFIDAIAIIAAPGFWVVMLGVFAMKAAFVGAPRTERIDRLNISPYLPRLVMEFGYWMFTLPIALLLRLGVTANVVTIASMVFTTGGAYFLGVGHFAVGGWLLLLAFSCDAWDGIIARERGTSSIGGEFFDSVVDRYNDLIGLFGIMYYYRDEPLPLAFAGLAALGSVVTSYARAKGESVGIDPNVGYMQRHERAVYLGGAAVFGPILALWVEPGVEHPHYHLMIASLALLAFLTNLTAIMRTRYVLVRLARGEGRP